MRLVRLGILGSGKGTNCRAILGSIRSGALAAEVRVVISDVFDAPILNIAREFSIPNAYLPPGQFRTRLEPQAENDLVRMLRDASVELVVLAGFMRVLKSPMLDAFPGEKVTGCTVHYVDEKIDHGDIIVRREVPILPNDTPESLHARIQIAEHELYPTVIGQICRQLSTA